VATFLLHIARRCSVVGCAPHQASNPGFDLPLSRSDMADFIGLTIETVSRQISKLRKDGILVMDGTRRVASVDLDRLAERAGI
jgi:CRP/FNR family transcriptional regulator